MHVEREIANNQSACMQVTAGILLVFNGLLANINMDTAYNCIGRLQMTSYTQEKVWIGELTVRP